jgi:hypothetical protein
MVARKKSTFDNKFKSITVSDNRTANIRTERRVKDEQIKLSLNFKDFDFKQCPPGQTLETWQEDKILDKLVKKFIDVCACSRIEALQKGLLKVYDAFPVNSQFKIPNHIQGDVEWGTIQRIGGQKPRLAGYIIGSTFYPVFLDKEHLFFPSPKKHT